MELDACQEGMPVGYVEGGAMAMNVMEWVDETSMPPFTISRPKVKYLLSKPSVIAGDGVLLDLAPFHQATFAVPEETVSEHLWPFSHTLASPDSDTGAQLIQPHYAQPPPDDFSPSTTSISSFQTPVNYTGSHHLNP